MVPVDPEAPRNETQEQRQKRERQRLLFDGVASLYDTSRLTYPSEVVEALLTTTGTDAGHTVLEIGCGTGQLTEQLAGRSLEVMAIDIGPAMIAAAERKVRDPMVTFGAAAFEDFEPGCSYHLVVSATAFHWVDPALAWAKTARLLDPRGWLALLTTGEKYDEPLASGVRHLWTKYAPERIEWTPRVPWAEPLRQSELFGEVVELVHEQRARIPAETVLGVECTRATYLDYERTARQGFAADLKVLLKRTPMVALTQETVLAMAPVAEGP
jgi:ubiquinone/menaquinone biosynthesis C-methylase UbiE